jgi:Skp1 family, tetramerisation domain
MHACVGIEFSEMNDQDKDGKRASDAGNTSGAGNTIGASNANTMDAPQTIHVDGKTVQGVGKMAMVGNHANAAGNADAKHTITNMGESASGTMEGSEASSPAVCKDGGREHDIRAKQNKDEKSEQINKGTQQQKPSDDVQKSNGKDEKTGKPEGCALLAATHIWSVEKDSKDYQDTGSDLTLISEDGKSFQIARDWARISGMIKSSSAISDAKMNVMEFKIKGHILALIVEYMREHKGVEPEAPAKPLRSKLMSENCPYPADAIFIDRVGIVRQSLYDLMMVPADPTL